MVNLNVWSIARWTTVAVICNFWYNCRGFERPIIPDDYDRLRAPITQDDPVQVKVFADISHVDLRRDQMHVIMYLHQYWIDPRLQTSQLQKSLTVPSEKILPLIWSPTLVFANSIQPTEVINPGFVRIISNGKLFWSQRIKQVIICDGSSLSARVSTNTSGLTCDIELDGGLTSDLLSLKAKRQGATLEHVQNNPVYTVVDRRVTNEVIRKLTGTHDRVNIRIYFDTIFNEKINSALLSSVQHHFVG